MKVVTILGARPEFIQNSSVSRALRSVAEEIIVHTGQHYDTNMSEIFFEQLQLNKPDYNLNVGSTTHGTQTAKMTEGIENILFLEKPDMVIVHGDTNSTVAGSLAASKLGIPISHIESGLRSYNKKMPEEINRIITDHVSTKLFCPTKTAVNNLKLEGITDHVYLVGDVMYDAILYYSQMALNINKHELLGLSSKRYYLATVHRAENTNDPEILKGLLDSFSELDHTVVFPVHPRTNKLIHQYHLDRILESPNIVTIPPASYLDVICLLSHAKALLTDSGGLQKEAYMLKVPCITLRNETEWIETVQAGWNRVVGTNTSSILAAASTLHYPNQYPSIFGDGHAAEKIAQLLLL